MRAFKVTEKCGSRSIVAKMAALEGGRSPLRPLLSSVQRLYLMLVCSASYPPLAEEAEETQCPGSVTLHRKAERASVCLKRPREMLTGVLFPDNLN